ncbi:hypothetical protein B0H67DRAFT_645633 [Lasiosphaeris hirsuta]|uniref:Ankyrin repeat protein n=1 Tax=Lasiosphaeris hirsuta TaxID=260670 RepID=A0AA40AHJ8_9PEZI|nr:hypothetical protein B0H67DRAFT_645633 [Lasiosphaeris hirsuta]
MMDDPSVHQVIFIINSIHRFDKERQGTKDLLRRVSTLRTASNSRRFMTVNQALYDATVKENEGLVTFLIERCGADVKARGDEFGNALTASVFNGIESILQTLLNLGADVNAGGGADPNAWSPELDDKTTLQAACRTGHLRIAEELIKHKANPDLGAKVGEVSGKYGSALAAAVARRDGVSNKDRLAVLSLLPGCGFFPREAYRGALRKAFRLGRRQDFELILASRQADVGHDLAKLAEIWSIMAEMRSKKAKMAAGRTGGSSLDGDDSDSDFGDDNINKCQDIYDALGVKEVRADSVSPP